MSPASADRARESSERDVPAVSIELSVKSPCAAEQQPITIGVPFPKGQLTDAVPLGLLEPHGQPLPLQTAPHAHWSDGSVKWLLLDTVLPTVTAGCARYTLTSLSADACPAGITVEESAGAIVVRTGPTTFHLSRTHVPFERVLVGKEELLSPRCSDIVLTDVRGRLRHLQVEQVSVETAGPVRTTVKYLGRFSGRQHCRFVARLCFFAGTGLVRVRLTVHNPRRARHRGGLWDLGDPNSLLFRDLSLELRPTGTAQPHVVWTAEPGHPVQEAPGGKLRIYQASSGGENWNSRHHANRHGVVPVPFRGYCVRQGAAESFGLRANPVVSLRTDTGRIGAVVPEFWQQFPKAIDIDNGRLRLGLFPQEFADPFELQGGEQKTHTLWLHFAAAREVPALDWVHQPARMHADPEWYADSGAIPHVLPAAAAPDQRLHAFLAEAIGGNTSFFAGREVADEYGWRNYGELYADHEAAHYTGPAPVVSHYNNQYDVLYSGLLQYYRTGDTRWFDLVDPYARHVVDIDIYHTCEDKVAYNGGLFWHTDHYKDAGTATHRCYSRVNATAGDSYGGGPGNAHNYASGLLHYYYATGDEAARDAVLSLADWVLNMDDGDQNIFGWIDNGPSGLATYNGEPLFNGPGRGSGNSINVLLDGWLLTRRQDYMDKAEVLIRRVIHPADDITARNLLNVEPRWSYTVFLSALGRYLHVKAEAGEIDFMFAYAHASLIHYARWMLSHELPYLDQVEKLQYPNETWAAQEFRKVNVMRIAAFYAEEPIRTQLVNRSIALAERAWEHLCRFQSRGTTRPRALLLMEGPKGQFLLQKALTAVSPNPLPGYDFGRPVEFAYQKDRVRLQLRRVGGIARLAFRLLNPCQWWRLKYWPY